MEDVFALELMTDCPAIFRAVLLLKNLWTILSGVGLSLGFTGI